MTATRLTLVFVLFLGVGLLRNDRVRAQEAGETAHGQEQEQAQAQADDTYRVGAGDVLEVEVFDDPDLSGLLTIQHGGEIAFPLLGELEVEGLTVKQVQKTLTDLLAKDYLVNPQVSVRVKDHRSQWVTVVGEVVRPGKYFLQGPKTLLDLLSEAGGFTAQASGEVMVSRPERLEGGDEDGGAPDGTVRVFLSPLQPPAEQKEALSLQLRKGDIVTATSTKFFYVSGEVKNPGSYAVTPGLSLLKALTVAGGLTKFASKGKVEILRKVANGETQRIRVDVGDIEGGKRPDVPLQAEDIIKVGRRVF
jgi:polysaccharide export outer membrane protein